MPSDKHQPLPIGTILDGKFRVTKEIGRGGMAAVFEAENIDIGKRVAVKVLAAELVTSRVVTERFIREARASAAVRSPYICDVYDVGTFENRPFLVMELLEGESLYDRLSRVRRLDVDMTLRIARQTARGLSKAHEAGIVHRDLKPENIFLTRNEEGEIVAKILDFGLAKFYEPANEGGPAARLTKEGALFGTPAYMSPEQAKAQGEVDQRADLWALGCIVYECLTGRTVWNVDQGVAMILAQIAGAPIPRASRFREDLPKTFDEWFLKALSRDPNDRFQSAREFSDALILALAPPDGSLKAGPLFTEREGEDIDKLVNRQLALRAAPVAPSAPAASAEPPNDDVAVPLPSTLPPAARARGPGFAILLLLLAGTVVGGGYYLWFHVLYPPGGGGAIRGLISKAAEITEGRRSAASEHDPVETEPFALQVRSGQVRLARGEPEAALRLFQEAFDSSKSNAARSFLAQAEIRNENTLGGSCQVTGLGRPRPFAASDEGAHSNDSPVSLPGLALTKAGLVAAWAELSLETHKRQVFTTVLDSSTLERIQPVVNVTPEGTNIQEPALWRVGGSVVLTYWEGGGIGSSEPGVFVRALDDMGHIASPPRRVFATERKQSYLSLANGPDGSLWTVWTERTSSKVSDLVLRRLDAKLSPLGDAARLTSYSNPKTGTSTASKAVLAIAHGFLNVAFAVERNQENQVFLLRISLQDPALRNGGLPIPTEAEAAAQQSDKFLGKIIPVSTGAGKHNEPDIVCVEDGCYVVWDDEKAGANAAFVSASSGEIIWRREIGPKALRPSVAASEREIALVWYEDKRLRLARMTKNGFEKPSVLARGSGVQPTPAVVPGESPGQWYVSWRDFEAARPEAFVLRAQCR